MFVAALPISEDRQVRICTHLSGSSELRLARVDVHLERKYAPASRGGTQPEVDTVQIDSVSKQKVASLADLPQHWQAKPGAVSLQLASLQEEAPARYDADHVQSLQLHHEFLQPTTALVVSLHLLGIPATHTKGCRSALC